MTELITVPSFIFHSEYGETAIQVNYYNGNIELVQERNSVFLNTADYEKLFKEIKRHRAEAEEYLAKRNI